MICDRRQGQHDSAAQRPGHILHWATMAGADAITEGNYKVHLSHADMGCFICQSNMRVILAHRPSFPKVTTALIHIRLSP